MYHRVKASVQQRQKDVKRSMGLLDELCPYPELHDLPRCACVSAGKFA
jgi:hypothetical protein